MASSSGIDGQDARQRQAPAIIAFTIELSRWSADGSPSQIVIAKPSGDSTLDASAVRALQRIDTFGPLPDGYAGQYINVQYYFEPKAQ